MSAAIKSDFDHPKTCNLSKRQIHEIAEQLAIDGGFKPADSVSAFIGSLGGKIEYVDFLEENSQAESLHVDSKGDFTVFLPVHTTLERDNFTLAHELGHYILHYLWSLSPKDSPPRPFVAYRYGADYAENKTEWEANWFAAAFLMPDKLFRAEFIKSRGILAVLAPRFKVTQKAAQIRAKSLSLKVS